MLKRTTSIALAVGLAGAMLACEDEHDTDLDIQRDQPSAQSARNDDAIHDTFDQSPQTGATSGTRNQPARTPGATTGTTPGATGTTGGATGSEAGTARGTMAQDRYRQATGEVEPGRPTSERSNVGFSATVARVQRQLRRSDMHVVGHVMLNQPQRTTAQNAGAQENEAAGKPAEQAPAQPQRRGRQRAELILFANPDALGDTEADPMQALSTPTAVLVYEDDLTGDVFVAYDDPTLEPVIDAAINPQGQNAGQQQNQSQIQGNTGAAGATGTQQNRNQIQGNTGAAGTTGQRQQSQDQNQPMPGAQQNRNQPTTGQGRDMQEEDEY